jgi:uncharacterized phage protein (TIGR01671 family)
MRTIKFRVYIKHCSKLFGDDGLVYPKEGTLHAYIRNWEKDLYKEAIFQQFTGLKDKKGNEIYEGDLLLVEGYGDTYEVQYVIDSEGTGFRLVSTLDKDWAIGLSSEHTYTVIGNIFEKDKLCV